MMNIANNIPVGFTLRYTFQGHREEINRIAWSPDGRYLASSSFDGTVRLWDIQLGASSHTLQQHRGAVYSVAWSPDGRYLASCSKDRRALIYEVGTFLPFQELRGHSDNVYDLSWSSDSKLLATCSEDHTVRIWNAANGRYLLRLTGHSSGVYCITRPMEFWLVSGSSGGPIRNWQTWPLQIHGEVELLSVSTMQTLRGHGAAVYNVVRSPDKKMLASCSEDRSIILWEMTGWRQRNILEAHTDAVTGISFSHDGRLLASKSRDGTIRLWRSDTWETVAILDAPASNGLFAGIAFHPSAPLLATLVEHDTTLHIWELDVPALLGIAPPQPSIHYASAKAVLVGESGVGKTALGMVLAGLPYTETSSTHGRYVRLFHDSIAAVDALRQEHRETYLWDLAGQSGYRLVHQLHLDEVAVALIVFTDKGGGDSLAGVAYWERALRTVRSVQGSASLPIKKFLVEARTDLAHVKMSAEQIEKEMRRLGFDAYYDTSALTGKGIAELAEAIKQGINWSLLPKVTSTDMFLHVKDFLAEQKKAGQVLLTSGNLYRNFLLSTGRTESSDVRAQFDSCLGSLQLQGLIRRLSFGELVLLQPERLDAYASALVNAVSADREGPGAIVETTVLEGGFAFPTGMRLADSGDEKLLLLAMVEDLLRYEIALRQTTLDGTYLIFPSEVTRRDTRLLEDPPGKAVIFEFEGPVLNIYATLVVRLSHSGVFRKQDLLQNAVIFAADVGGTCGIALRDLEEGRGELTLFFDGKASRETRFHFAEYVNIHLERHAAPGSIRRRHIFRCSACEELLTDSQVARRRERGFDWLQCPVCGERVSLRSDEEHVLPLPTSLIPEMDRAANAQVELETAKSILQGKIETNDFDVFLLYNPQDEQQVRAIGDKLKERGILPFMKQWDLQPGLPEQRQLQVLIDRVRSAAVFIGGEGIEAWELLTLETFLDQFSSRKCPVIPVLLPGVSGEPPLPLFFRGMVAVDFRRQDPDPMSRLVWGITNKRPL